MMNDGDLRYLMFQKNQKGQRLMSGGGSRSSGTREERVAFRIMYDIDRRELFSEMRGGTILLNCRLKIVN